MLAELLCSPVLWLTIVGLAVAKLLQSILRLWQLHQCLRRLPTDSYYHPLLGNAPKLSNDEQDTLSYIMSWHKVSSRLFVLWVTAFRPIIFVYHPDLIKIVLQASDNKPLSHGDVMRNVRPWLGDGLVTSNGQHWQRSRRLLTPAFHFDILKPYVDVYNDCANILLESLDKMADSGKSIDIYPLLKLCTFDIILRCAMSVNLDVQRQTEEIAYVKSCDRLLHIWGERNINVFQYFDTIFMATATGKEFMRHCELVHSFAEDVIAKRRRTLEQEGPPKTRYLDLVDILLTAKDENGQHMSTADIRAEVDTFLFAGHETSSTATSWLLYNLCQHQEHQEMVQQEVDAILKGRDSSEILWSDLAGLDHLTCCMKESLRVYPPVATVTRQLTKDVVMDGAQVPAGTRVSALILNLHHNPEIFPQPEEFRPERFTKENCQSRSPFAFVPFAAGPRNCIGQNFAANEIKVLAAKVLHRFELVSDPERPVKPKAESILHSESGIWMFVKRRTPYT